MFGTHLRTNLLERYLIKPVDERARCVFDTFRYLDVMPVSMTSAYDTRRRVTDWALRRRFGTTRFHIISSYLVLSHPDIRLVTLATFWAVLGGVFYYAC